MPGGLFPSLSFPASPLPPSWPECHQSRPRLCPPAPPLVPLEKLQVWLSQLSPPHPQPWVQRGSRLRAGSPVLGHRPTAPGGPCLLLFLLKPPALPALPWLMTLLSRDRNRKLPRAPSAKRASSCACARERPSLWLPGGPGSVPGCRSRSRPPASPGIYFSPFPGSSGSIQTRHDFFHLKNIPLDAGRLEPWCTAGGT